MKTTILSALFALLFTVAFAAMPASGQVYADEGIRLEIDPVTKDLLVVLDEEETDRGHTYEFKIRLNPGTYTYFHNVAESTDFEKMSEEEAELAFGPFLKALTPAMKSAERKCELYKCKQIIVYPTFKATTVTTFVIKNALQPGQPAIRTTNVNVTLPETILPRKNQKKVTRNVST